MPFITEYSLLKVLKNSGLWQPRKKRTHAVANEKNIREVTMFPMNQNAQDLMMNAPSEVNEKQLKELNISLKNKK